MLRGCSDFCLRHFWENMTMQYEPYMSKLDHQNATCLRTRSANAVNAGTCNCSRYLDMVDEVGLYSARCGERSQQLGIELDLLQDGRQNLLTILAYCGDGINQHSEDNLHTSRHLLHCICKCNS